VRRVAGGTGTLGGEGAAAVDDGGGALGEGDTELVLMGKGDARAALPSAMSDEQKAAAGALASLAGRLKADAARAERERAAAAAAELNAALDATVAPARSSGARSGTGTADNSGSQRERDGDHHARRDGESSRQAHNASRDCEGRRHASSRSRSRGHERRRRERSHSRSRSRDRRRERSRSRDRHRGERDRHSGEGARQRGAGYGEAGRAGDSSRREPMRAPVSSAAPHDGRPAATASPAVAPPSWLAPGIRVRVADSAWREGRLFKLKAVVQDVPAPGRATLAFMRDDGSSRLVEDVPQRVLETALPKPGGHVLVVGAGRHRGARGVLLERNSGAGTASVRLLRDERIITLSLDDVAEYVSGAVED
jgi:hypothetical protein